VPVTTKAQQSEEYRDYLSRAGDLDENGDNYQYYAPKIEVTKLLLHNIENTFITPVFNGSASLRMASGEMIEQVLNATIAKPKRIVDDAFIDKLYSDMVALYRLDNVGRFDGGDLEGGLPIGSTLLLVGIGLVWCGIGTYLAVGFYKSSKEKEEKKKKSSDT
jgi:multiple sugar transport system substrate-binding protein